jgi:hypothetical protein
VVRTALLVGFALGFAQDPNSCGDTNTTASGVNAPCTRDGDCHPGLKCPAGVCIDPNASQDAGSDAADGGARGDSGSDASDQ